MRSQLDLLSCREACVKLEVAGSILWCITYKKPGWGCDGDGNEDEDGEEKGETRTSSLLLQVLCPLMRFGLVCSLMPPISGN